MNLLLNLEPFPHDSGPIYQETLAGRLPVEPFNTFSNIFFLLIILYFSIRVYSDYRQQRFFSVESSSANVRFYWRHGLPCYKKP